MALLLASVSNLALISAPMIKYRQHSTNQLGGVKKSLMRQISDAFQVNRDAYYKLEIQRYEALYHHLLNLSKGLVAGKTLPLVKPKSGICRYGN